MKRGLFVVLALALLITACAKEEAPAEELPAEEVPEETTPACADKCGDGTCDEIVCMAVGCPCSETKESCAADCGDERSFRVKEGDTISYRGKTILVSDVDNYGSLVYLEEGVEKLKLVNTKNPEIWNNYEYVISESTFNKDRSVTITIKPLVLGKDEYLFYKLDKKAIAGKTVEIGRVYSDASGVPMATVSVNEGDVSEGIRLNQPAEIEGLEFTLLRAFKTSNEYAIIKIVQK